MEKYIVSRDDTIYEAWPDIVKTSEGTLICLFTECNHHGDRGNSRLMLTRSTDEGKSWSPKTAFTEVSEYGYYNCGRITRMPDDRLVITADLIAGNENKSSEIYIWYGNAEGTEWSESVRTGFCGIVPDKLRVLQNGRMLAAAHFMGESGKPEQYLWYSDDGGST